VGQATSGTGCLYNSDSKSSLTAAGRVVLDPWSLGGRFFYCSSLFTQYKVNRCKFTYVPYSGQNGLLNTPTGSGSTSAVRTFALGAYPDPAAAFSTFNDDVADGAVVMNTTRRGVLDVGARSITRWLFTSASAASPSGIDERLCSFATLSAHFPDTSTTAAVQYGVILLDIDVSFRGMIASDPPIGLSLPGPSTDRQEDEKEISLLSSARQVRTGGTGYIKEEKPVPHVRGCPCISCSRDARV